MSRLRTPSITRRRLAGVIATLAVGIAAPLGAQAPLKYDTVIAMMAANRPSCDDNGVDAGTFNALLERRFAALVSPATEGLPGGFLAVDTKDPVASAAQSFNVGTNALTFSVHGGFNDGVMAIFNNATLSPKFGGGIQFHRLSGGRQALQFVSSTCAALDATVRRADATLALKLAQIRTHADDVQRRVDRIVFAEKKRKMDDLVAALKPPVTPRDSLYQDSVRVEQAQATARYEMLDWVRVPDAGSAALAAVNEHSKAYQDARALLDVRGFSFGWWSFGATLDNSSVTLFDPQAELVAQISKRTSVARTANITYSRIQQSTFDEDSWYVAFAAKAGWEDNLSSLTKLNLIDRKQYAAPPAERVSETATTVYQGAYKTDIATIRVAATSIVSSPRRIASPFTSSRRSRPRMARSERSRSAEGSCSRPRT